MASWLPTAGGDTPERLLAAVAPTVAARLGALTDGFRQPDALEPAVLELCRRRITMLHRYDPGPAPGPEPPAAQCAALSAWPTSPLFTTLERACLGFAEQFVMDPHGMTDTAFADLRRHLDARALATLALAVATFDATMRFAVAMGDD